MRAVMSSLFLHAAFGAALLAGCVEPDPGPLNLEVTFMNADVASCYAADPTAPAHCCRLLTFRPDGHASLVEAWEGSPPGTYTVTGTHATGTIWYGQSFEFDLETLVGTGPLATVRWADDDPVWDAKVCNSPE